MGIYEDNLLDWLLPISTLHQASHVELKPHVLL